MHAAVLDQRVLQQGGQIHLTGAGTGRYSFDFQKVGAAHQLIDSAHAALGTEVEIHIRKKFFKGTVVKKRFYEKNYKK